MLHSIKRFFEHHLAPRAAEQPGATDGPPLRDRLTLAAAALLLEVAHADGEFTDDEQAHLEHTLIRHFGLALGPARELIALAEQERRRAADLYQFTSLVNTHYDEGQRLLLAEIMWRLVYADGELARHEDYLMQRLSGLLDLRPGYLAEAHKRAVADPASGVD